MRRLTILCAGLLLLSFGATSYAARDGALAPVAKPLTQRDLSSRLEVLVFEIEGCALCDVFRRDIVPQYQAGPAAARAPLRFVDINTTDPDTLALRRSLSQLPTAVLMQDGREVDRIVGYVGPTNFFRMLDTLLSRAD